jgi:hypothetical protein
LKLGFRNGLRLIVSRHPTTGKFTSKIQTKFQQINFQSSEPNGESALWNAMIAPLTKTSIRGAIWYQGSTNVAWNADYYTCHMIALVQDWKNTFADGNVPAENGVAFPFGIIQAK